MKVLISIFIGLLVLGCGKEAGKKLSEEEYAVKLLKDLVAQIDEYDSPALGDIRYNAEKTESLVTPYKGIVVYTDKAWSGTTSIEITITLGWTDGKWKFRGVKYRMAFPPTDVVSEESSDTMYGLDLATWKSIRDEVMTGWLSHDTYKDWLKGDDD